MIMCKKQTLLGELFPYLRVNLRQMSSVPAVILCAVLSSFIFVLWQV